MRNPDPYVCPRCEHPLVRQVEEKDLEVWFCVYCGQTTLTVYVGKRLHYDLREDKRDD